MALKGHLQHFGLGELFQTLACNRHTGTLYVSSETEKKTIYFSTGSIAFLGSGEGTVRLGEILQRTGKVTEAQIETAAREQEGSDKQIGRILLEQGAIDQSDLQFALRTKFEEELYELLLWEEGDFEFVPDFCPPDLLEPMQRYTQVRVDPQSVIIEGLRQLDESRIIRSRIPDPRIWVEPQVRGLPADAELTDIDVKIWQLCTDGRPVDQIQEQSPDTRFRTLKSLYRFVEEGWLRTYTFEEHLEIARRLRRHNEQIPAAELYRFLRDWGVDESQSAAFLDEAGRYLIEVGRKKEGAQTLGRALDRLRHEGDHAGAWEVGRLLRDLSPHDLELLQQLWPMRNSASTRAVEELRRELLTALKREGRYHDAEALLAETEELEGDQAEYWVVRSEIARKLNQRDNAIQYLQRGEQIAEEQGNGPEAIRIARTLYEIDPDIPGLRTKIQSLIQREEGAQRARRIRRIVAGSAAALVLAIAIPSIRYELKARNLYRSSLELRTAEAAEPDLVRARHQLSRIVEEYKLSTVASRSREDLTEVKSRLRELQSDEMARLNEIENRDRLARESRRGEAGELLADSKSAIAQGEFERARELVDTLLAGAMRSLPIETQNAIRLPLSIESSPPGATVIIDGERRGVTPYVHRFSPGTKKFAITLSRPGCMTTEIEHIDDGSARLRTVLARAPLATGALLGGLDRPAVRIPGHIVVPCRDGRVYVLPGDRGVVKLASRVLAGGEPGHPSARVLVSGEFLVVAAFNGDIHCVNHRTWDTAWTLVHDSPILSAAVTRPGAIALGDERGRVILIDVASGQELNRLETGFPIDRIAVRGDVLIATDRVRRARTLELPSLESLMEKVLSGPIAAVLWDGSFLLADGTHQSFGERSRWPVPLTEVVDRNGRRVYGGDRKWVEITTGSATAYSAPAAISCTPLPIGDLAFLGSSDGQVYCVERNGDVLWSLPTNSVPVDLLRTENGDVLVLLRSGQLLLIEGKLP